MISRSFTDFINFEINYIKENGVVFSILEKLKERNPFIYSKEYQNQKKSLKKHLFYLIKIENKCKNCLKEKYDPLLQAKMNDLHQRIIALKMELDYFAMQETTQAILKWSTPCNFIAPGSGDYMRIAAYCFKVINALHYYSPEKVKRVGKEISLAGSITVSSRFVYQKFYHLKNYLTYSSFRSLMHSTFDK